MNKIIQKNKMSLNNTLLVAIGLVMIIIVSRLIGHVWNFTAVGGVALFSGAYFSKKHVAILIPFFGLFISDLVLGFHDQMFAVYFSYALIAVLGFSLKLESSRFKTVGVSFAGAILFFLITNFGCWIGNAFYPQNLNGLLESYVLGLPFFRTQVLSDIISSLVIFELAKQAVRFSLYQVRPGQSL
ncbi:MAG: DUF6580 family putative transport protein [Pseudobdellovibrio sp.]